MDGLKSQRATLRMRLTKLENATKVLEDDPTLLLEHRQKKLKLDSIWSELERVENQIINGLADEDEKQVGRDALLDEEERYQAPAPKTPDKTVKSEGAQGADIEECLKRTAELLEKMALGQHNPRQQEIERPKIKQLRFTGEIEDWFSFAQLFECLTKDLTNVQKLAHLQKACEGGAAEDYVKHFQLNDASFDAAWKKLEAHFGQVKLAVSSYIRSFINLPTVPPRNAQAMRRVHTRAGAIIQAIDALGPDAGSKDFWLTHLLVEKFDADTRREWAISSAKTEYPTFAQFLEFVDMRCIGLEGQEMGKKGTSDGAQAVGKSKASFKSTPSAGDAEDGDTTSKGRGCAFCSGGHLLWQCSQFAKLPAETRLEKVRGLGHCENCLGRHPVDRCRMEKGCKQCGERHNSSLHELFVSFTDRDTTFRPVADSTHYSSAAGSANSIASRLAGKGILATVLLDVCDRNGGWFQARALIDSGSELHYMTNRLAQILRLPKFAARVVNEGIGGVKTESHHAVRAVIRAPFSGFTESVEFVTLPTVVGILPSSPIDVGGITIPEGIHLADPKFDVPAGIDMLLGADLFYELISHIRIPLAPGLWLQETAFGYVVVGRRQIEYVDSSSAAVTVIMAGQTSRIKEEQFDCSIRKFWEIEERSLDSRRVLSSEERHCEEHFKATHFRQQDGRYVVMLPFRADLGALGPSRDIAERRFRSIERRFRGQAEVWSLYGEFMDEYLKLGHMEVCRHDEETQRKTHCFLPHHPVIRPDKLTTKLRVVFDGSAPSASNKSLNEILANGPKIQSDILPLLLRFRENPVAYILDLKKMYRQVKVHDDQCHLQSILWRQAPDQPLLTYHLKTVTYGTASGAWLAVRAVKQLAIDEGDAFPTARKILEADCYVDDVATSFPTLPEAIEAALQLKALLSKGQFESHKWASNNSGLLAAVGEGSESPKEQKVLGVSWDTQDDTFRPLVPPFMPQSEYTKRDVASEIAKFFDPLGLIGPVVQRMKVMLQRLWQMKHLEWDTPLDEENGKIWETFRRSLSILDRVQIPRCVCPGESTHIQLHGFSDSSQDGFGACIYVRTTFTNGLHEVRLLTSKSRVAPHKRVSIPRLELLGAVLLAEYMDVVKRSFRRPIDRTIYHCDSSTVLAWINRPSAELKLFVGNRVSAIHTLTDPSDWRFVRSELNPADCLSRGATAEALIDETLWWHGPEFLHQDEEHWPASTLDRFAADVDPLMLSEMKDKRLTLIGSTNCAAHPPSDEQPSVKTRTLPLLERFSSFAKTRRVAGYCARYALILLQRVRDRKSKVQLVVRERLQMEIGKVSSPTVAEMVAGERMLIGFAQRERFEEEIRLLSKGCQLRRRSHILKLSPFLDNFGLLRVGGRIQRSAAADDYKHQLLLPKGHPFSRLLVRHTHEANCHAAPLLLVNTLRQRYWIVNDSSLAKRIYHDCFACFRARPKPATQVMGWLPAERITPTSRPFVFVGVDYCGPYFITFRLRGRPLLKVWICIFICLVTHAVHIELVFDCTAAEMIAALHRFVSRRGPPKIIRSDNSTTFVGADNEIKRLFESPEFNATMTHECKERYRFEWRFIPPASPHHGGMWEAAVKSFKSHLKRLTDAESFTTSELLTLIARIEACLNSRPLSPMSSSPDDLQPLTPGHFIIGGPLNAMPEGDFVESKVSRLDRYQKIQQLAQIFWKRWSSEILHTMQQRAKWNKAQIDIAEGDLVLLVEKDLPPLQWPTGRIQEVRRGPDGKVRIVVVKTLKGVYERSIVKVCPLPKDDNNEETEPARDVEAR